jgi:hypothetical protein
MINGISHTIFDLEGETAKNSRGFPTICIGAIIPATSSTYFSDKPIFSC